MIKVNWYFFSGPLKGLHYLPKVFTATNWFHIAASKWHRLMFQLVQEQVLEMLRSGTIIAVATLQYTYFMSLTIFPASFVLFFPLSLFLIFFLFGGLLFSFVSMLLNCLSFSVTALDSLSLPLRWFISLFLTHRKKKKKKCEKRMNVRQAGKEERVNGKKKKRKSEVWWEGGESVAKTERKSCSQRQRKRASLTLWSSIILCFYGCFSFSAFATVSFSLSLLPSLSSPVFTTFSLFLYLLTTQYTFLRPFFFFLFTLSYSTACLIFTLFTLLLTFSTSHFLCLFFTTFPYSYLIFSVCLSI